ncbi:putative ABC transporter permease subunit [Halobacillus sp. B29]|uniref:putative ABC transporter permease subunit n=1 Tax=Halobacillus sp. B29 TaxID=3457432 RepID=UPI003FCDD509
MSNAWKLMKIMVKMQLSWAGKSSSEKVGYVIMALALIPFGALILFSLNSLIGNLYNALSPTGNESVILALFFILMFVIFLVTSIGTVLSSFYFAEDVESFIALPFHPYQIVLGKSAVPFLSLYGLNALILLPVLLFYGLHSSAGLLYYLFAILLWAVTPVIPFVLLSIVLMFLMRFANISKNKDRTKIIVGMFGFIFAIGINVVIRLDSGGDGSGTADLIREQNGLLELVTGFFPTAYFSSIALTQPGSLTGVLYLLLMLGLSIGFAILFLTVGQKVYFKGVLGLSGGTRGHFNEKKIHKTIKQKPIIYSLWLKEMRIIFRTPAFFTQIVVQSLFFPVFLLVILFMESNTSVASLGSLLTQLDGKKLVLGLFGFTLLAVGMTPASFSSISRDGKSWFNHLHLPIAPQTVLRSKIVTAFTLNLLTIAILSFAALFLVQVSFKIWIIWLLLALVTNWVTSIGGLIIDLYSPKLDWTDEREVFKGRFIGLAMLAIEATVFGTLILILWNVSAISGIWVTSGVLLTFLIILIAACHAGLKRLSDKRYYSIH